MVVAAGKTAPSAVAGVEAWGAHNARPCATPSDPTVCRSGARKQAAERRSGPLIRHQIRSSDHSSDGMAHVPRPEQQGMGSPSSRSSGASRLQGGWDESRGSECLASSRSSLVDKQISRPWRLASCFARPPFSPMPTLRSQTRSTGCYRRLLTGEARVRTDRIGTTRMTTMANIRFVSGGQMEVPDDARLTDRGMEWLDEDGLHHVVPWTAVVEFTGPPPTPPTPI